MVVREGFPSITVKTLQILSSALQSVHLPVVRQGVLRCRPPCSTSRRFGALHEDSECCRTAGARQLPILDIRKEQRYDSEEEDTAQMSLTIPEETGSLERSQPKARFSNRLPNGDFLTLAVWPGKKDPTAEILTIQIRHSTGDTWETAGRLAVYRTKEGNYRQLPERQPPIRTTEAQVSVDLPEEREDSEDRLPM